MASPFPGMDPYLEDPAFWPDFHHRFIDDLCDAIANELPDPYEARLDESINLIQASPEVIKLIYPELAVTRAKHAPSGKRKSGSATLLEPVTLPHEIYEELKQARIEIIHRPERSLVTILEVLSPFNKTGDGHKQYRAKRAAILGQYVHLVELDLLVGGDRPALRVPLPAGDYYAYVSRRERRFDCEVYAWTVRDRLPTIPVPLKEPDADVLIDLAEPFDIAYERGRYAKSLFYGKAPKAALKRADAQWASSLSARKKPRRPA